MEFAARNPRLLPTSYIYTRPVETESGAPLKNNEVTYISVNHKDIDADVDFAAQMSTHERQMCINADVKEYMQFLYAFAIALK